MPGGFADVTGFTAHHKNLYAVRTRTELDWDRVFHAKHNADPEGRKDQFDV